MCDAVNTQMVYRYLRRHKTQILFLVTCSALLIYWFPKFKDRQATCLDPRCIGSHVTRRFSDSSYMIDVYKVLNIKPAKVKESVLKRVKQDGQLCQRPNFDLNHDSIAYAFHPMTKLNCSRVELFTLTEGEAVLRKGPEVLKNRELEKCVYFGIERVNDDYATYTKPIIQYNETFDIAIKHEFARIKCYYKDSRPGDANSRRSGRKLLSDKNKSNFTLHPNRTYDKALKFVSENKPNNSSRLRNLKQVDTAEVNVTQERVKNIDIDEGNDANKEEESQLYVDEDSFPYDRGFYDYRGFDEDIGFMDERLVEDEADFDQFLVQVNPKPEVFKRAAEAMKKMPGRRSMNVLMFGLDSMSHLAYQRKLPLTYDYIRNTLDAVMLDGYNIVGDATVAALIPMLTGKAEEELPNARKNYMVESKPVDVYPLIWKDFKHQGYATLLAEDEPSIGVFNLRLNGFREQPTDHYMRPFWQALWDSNLRKTSPKYCTGNQPNHMFLFQYLKQFFDKYEKIPKFAFVFGSELTHWDNNPGEYMDRDFLELLQYLKSTGHLDNTLLIVMADHGARYSRVRKTMQGKMEERLPMMSLTFPDWFRRQYPVLYKNLETNSQRLVTPFDIHKTLKDVLNLPGTADDGPHGNRGLSLLRPIPRNRTCSAAGIDMHWCTCLQQLALDVSDHHVVDAARAVLVNINKRTEKVRGQCVELLVKQVLSAYLLIPNEQVLKFQHTVDAEQRKANFSSKIQLDHVHIQITMETMPNQGMFEATVQVNMTSNVYKVMEGMSRIDRYGNQPACIQEKLPLLREFCYCSSHNTQLDKDS